MIRSGLKVATLSCALALMVGCGAAATAAQPAARGVSAIAAHDAGTGGPFMFVGGGADQDDLMRQFMTLAGGTEAEVVIVPLASDHPAQSGQAYVDYLRTLGSAHAHFLVPATPAPGSADLALLGQAHGLFFSGGDQARILGALTPGWRAAIADVWRRGAVVAGTSAGSMVWGQTAILDGDPMETGWYGEDPAHAGIRLGAGLGLAPGLVVDTHFSQRGRVPRLSYAVAKARGTLGIGVDPMTAAVVYPDGRLEVRGRGTVTLIRVPAQQLKSPMSLHDVHLDVLSAGDATSVKASAAAP